MWLQGDIGLNVAQMLVELIRDNRKIVDRITQDQIRMFVDLLQINKVSLTHFTYLIISLTAYLLLGCLQSFDAVGWAAGRASGL